MCALLHDNALTQYISEEVRHDLIKDQTMDISSKKLGVHCVYGEQNIKKLPFYTDVTNVILYHHENADGTGPFRKNGRKSRCLQGSSICAIPLTS